MRTTTISTPINQLPQVLSSLSRDQLRNLAKKHGVPTARYKRDMVARLLNSNINAKITIS